MSQMTKFKHPQGLYWLFAVEMWERFSYYGMRALLTLYMVNGLLFSTEKAGQIYGIYTGLVYLTPLIGGYIADRYFGARKCILIGCILMALGHFSMAFSQLPFFFTALCLLIIGNGFFKPNISTILGQLYEKNDVRKDSGFTIFYVGINLGAFFSPLICGTLGEKVGFHYGFAAAGVGMVIATTIFLLGREHFKENLNQDKKIERIKNNSPLTIEEKQQIGVIFLLMFFSIFFWAAFEQAGSSLTLFAYHSTNRIIPFINWEMPASYFQAINPLFIFLLAPLFSSMWLKLISINKNPSITMKFAIGLGFASLGFILMILAANFADEFGKVSILWLFAVYLLHTIGELCLSPVGLSAVTKLAPVQFASLLMGLWFLASFFANTAAGFFAGNYDTMVHAQFFAIPAITAGIAALLLLFLIKPINKWMHGVK